MTWQPIETAPKDGTRIIALAPHGAVEAWWKRIEKVNRPGQFSEAWRYFEPRGRLIPSIDPKYWMPLPAPPLLGEEQAL